MTLGELADASGLPPGRVYAAFVGELPDMSESLSLVAQGLARQVTDARGIAFARTPAGEAYARAELGDEPP